MGIDVLRTRYINVILGGMVAGIGGAFLVIGATGRFDKDMTAGRGFIGLAAMIFGAWTPIGSFLAASCSASPTRCRRGCPSSTFRSRRSSS